MLADRVDRVTRARVVETARTLLGVPFLHQGSWPDRGGIDCRGVFEQIAWLIWAREIPERHYPRRPSGAEFLAALRAEVEEIDVASAREGDFVLLRFPKADESQHGGVLAAGPYEMHLIHAWETKGRGQVIEEPWRGWKVRHTTHAFRLPVSD